MTDLAQRMLKDAALSRPEQAALAIGQLAERAPQGARLGTKKELQEQCGVAKSTFNEASASCSPVGSSPSGQVPAGDCSQPHGPPLLVLATPSSPAVRRKEISPTSSA